MRKITASQIALGGVFAALASVLMLLGGIVPAAMYICPMLASGLLVVLIEKLGKPLSWGWYAVVCLLSLLLCPDRETAFVFVFLGWYPLVREPLDRLPARLRVCVKMLIFAAAVCAMYALMIFVLGMQSVSAELKETQTWLLVVLLILGSAAFLVFDLLLRRFTRLYRLRSGGR